MKIQPINNQLYSKNDQTNVEEETSPIKPIQTTKCGGVISVRSFIIILITSLLFTCSLLIWLTSFIGSREAMNVMSSELMTSIGDSVLHYMDGQLRPYTAATESIADDYNLQIIPGKPSLSYLYKMFIRFKPYGIGLFFNDSLNSVNVYGPIDREFPVWYTKPVDEKVLYAIGLNTRSLTNVTSTNIVTQSPNYETFLQSYWNVTFSNFKDREGAFGIPYAIPGNPSYTTYYCVKLFDPSLYMMGIKQVVGFAKTNISLRIIQAFLKTVDVLNNGFVIVSEMNNLVIGGSINTTALDGFSRVSIFELIDSNAGSVLESAHKKYGNWEETPSFFEADGHFIVKSTFSLANLKWNVFVVVEKNEIELVSNITSGISVAITILIIIFGIIMSIAISHIVTHPFTILEKEFRKIKTMELENVNISQSKFSEVDTIYLYLYEMTVWLNEIKTFIPESVFLQLRIIEHDKNGLEETPPHSKHEVRTSFSPHNSNERVLESNSSMISKIQETSSSLFKIGLNRKYSSIIRVKLEKFSKELNCHNVENLFAKMISGMSVIAKNVQGDLQVITVDDYQIYVSDGKGRKSSNILALEAALKLRKLFATINETSQTNIQCSIGISSGKSNSGNLGTNSFRIFTTVGNVPSNAEKLALLALSLNCNIVCDENTLNEDTRHHFVTRPIDKLLLDSDENSNGVSSIVFEVDKEITIEGDEWMYELEQQKANQKFTEFGKFFFYNQNLKDLSKDEILKYFQELQGNLLRFIEDSNNNSSTHLIGRKLLKNMKHFYNLYNNSNNMLNNSVIIEYYSIVKHAVFEYLPSITDETQSSSNF